ncbi:MAG: response regulator [Ignavibacteriae bacterium]|nr:MAG: response regulator [Ignavibacteriota bacterium]
MSSRETILIVEDEETLRDLLRMMLEDNGFKVIQAVDGLEAVELFREHQNEIGVVLSDLGLPRLGGWEAFVKMKEINPRLIGILASGFFNKNTRKEIINSGAKDFIAKPYNSAQIIALVRQAFDEVKKDPAF